MRARPGDGNTRMIFYHVIALCIQTYPGDFISKDEISSHPHGRSISLLNLWTDKQWLTKMNTSSPHLGCDWWNWAENSSAWTSSSSSTIWTPPPPRVPWGCAESENERRLLLRAPGVILGLEYRGGGREHPEVQCKVDCLLLEYKPKVCRGGSVSDRRRGHPEINAFDF